MLAANIKNDNEVVCQEQKKDGLLNHFLFKSAAAVLQQRRENNHAVQDYGCAMIMQCECNGV